MTYVLSTQNLSKRYGKAQVLEDLSLNISKGSIFGLLGPNGSGKTTTLGILLDIIPATSGTYQWFGEEPSHHTRKRMGALLETPNFLGYLNAERNLRIVADIKGVPHSDIDRVLKIVGLLDRKKDAFQIFSLGMKQRLAIASALLGNPELLLLDEPTNGLDPQGISEIRELIMRVADMGITIVLASHMLDEVEKVCSHMAIIKKGKLLVQGSVDEILGDEHIIKVSAKNMESLKASLKKIKYVKDVKKELDVFKVKLADGISNEEINKALYEDGVVVNHLETIKKNLETQFLEITTGS